MKKHLELQNSSSFWQIFFAFKHDTFFLMTYFTLTFLVPFTNHTSFFQGWWSTSFFWFIFIFWSTPIRQAFFIFYAGGFNFFSHAYFQTKIRFTLVTIFTCYPVKQFCWRVKYLASRYKTWFRSRYSCWRCARYHTWLNTR